MVNSERYRAMLSEFLFPKIKEVDMNVKDKCYANHPETIEALKHEIKVAIHGIEAQTIANVLKNWIDRMEYFKASHGSHLNDIMFHS